MRMCAYAHGLVCKCAHVRVRACGLVRICTCVHVRVYTHVHAFVRARVCVCVALVWARVSPPSVRFAYKLPTSYGHQNTDYSYKLHIRLSCITTYVEIDDLQCQHIQYISETNSGLLAKVVVH